jgi:hypothetical protein
VETYVVRLWLPDRPGALGQVASRIGSVRGDVVGIDILETGNGTAVDELVVQLPDPSVVDLLVHEIGQVDGVKVEEIRSLGSGGHDPRLDALETAAILVGASSPTELLEAVCEHAGRSLAADWVAVVEISTGAIREGSSDVPSPEWLGAFLLGSRSASSLSGLETGCDDVAWAPLPGADLALVVGRGGTAYRARERRQLAALARIVDTRFRELVGQAHRYHPSTDVSNDLLGREISEGERS